MIRDINCVSQALLGTLFTWFVTALGSGVVFLAPGKNRRLLDGSLGFAAGVMTAASFWSLLAPAIEIAQDGGGSVLLPVLSGFGLGTLFVYGADRFMERIGLADSDLGTYITSAVSRTPNIPPTHDHSGDRTPPLFGSAKPSLSGSDLNSSWIYMEGAESGLRGRHTAGGGGGRGGDGYVSDPLALANGRANPANPANYAGSSADADGEQASRLVSWRRILLLVVAITVHNIPEGLAVGVGFGAIGRSPRATFESARNLALGIGLQNFPEGLAVSVPLRASGLSLWAAFWWGQLSGLVEPLAGLAGAAAVSVASPLLPYALAFAAGAMVYVVFDDIVPEAQRSGNGKFASACAVGGFMVMMALDVGLGA